jgi:DNA invertase Pin-like site-specific DNA recombinase
MTNCYIYMRASTNPKKQRNSIEVQRSVLSSFASRHGMTIKDEYVEYRTGADDTRPTFNSVLKRCIDEQAVLLTWKVDRLSRSLSIFNKIQDHLHLLRFAELGNTEPNIMVLSVLLGVSHQERLNTSCRVRATYKALKKQTPDLKWGNPRMHEDVAPLGLKVRKTNAREFNANIQSLCEDFRKAGYSSVKELACKLNSIGVKTRRGSLWTIANLHRTLSYEV